MTRTEVAAADVARGAARRGFPLLAAKLSPPALAHPTVPRPRLIAALSDAVRRSPLTLVSGPAGSGKTTLAASWWQIEDGRRPVAWLTLDFFDDDPLTFWDSVMSAFVAAGVDEVDLPSLPPGEPPPASFLPELASRIAALERPVVLVLDNADQITDREIVAGLDLLIRHASNRLRLLLCARTDPALPLHRYRVAGTMTEIRGERLAFTPEEARELLAVLGAPVTAEVAAGICAETQGWAVGLRLAAAPLKQGVPPERLADFLTQDDGSVAQYLDAEVLDGQPTPLHRFLLRISVTDELWPDLVVRLSGRPNSGRLLAGLAHGNAFVDAAPGAPGGFRVHPLLRATLSAQLAAERPAEAAALHRVCAEWYADAGRGEEAVEHAVAAEDWPLACRLLVDGLLSARLLAGGADAMRRALDGVPEDLAGRDAAVTRAVVALAEGRAPRPADLAAAATARDPGNRVALRAAAALTCVAAAPFSADPERLVADADVAARLVAEVPVGDRLARRDALAVLQSIRALAMLRTDAPLGTLLPGVRSAARIAGYPHLRARTVAALALLEAVEGDLTRAVHLTTESDALVEEGGRDEPEAAAIAATALGWVHLQRYALADAAEWQGRARARARGVPSPAVDTAPLLAVLQSGQFRVRHEYDSARQVLAPFLNGPRRPRWVAERVAEEAARLALARGETAEGLALLDAHPDAPWSRRLRAAAGLLAGEAVPASAEEATGDGPVGDIEALVLRACRLLGEERGPDAVAALERALELARPELLRRPFFDAPPQVRRLLRTAPRLQEPAAWLNPSSSAQPRAVGGMRSADAEEPEVVQDLSEREKEVLRHLATMLSTPEIAATMFISVNTVRTHIRSILRKLGVTRRSQAVRRARERGLL